MKFRKESDSLGEVAVPTDKYYGAQTARSLANFVIGGQKMPLEVIYALAQIKKAAAIVHAELGLLTKTKANTISKVCDEILAGKLDDHFPLVVWQTGSGTQTNMNVNEVISNRGIELLGGVMGSKDPIHPNDDVNKSQSSNDVFPTAMHLAALKEIHKHLLPNLKKLRDALHAKSKEFKDITKVGRTHLMDATSLTLGQEFSGYVSQLDHSIKAIKSSLSHLSEVALGGTAVGTGVNTHPGYAKRVIEVLKKLTDLPLVSAPNKFESLAANDAVVATSASLRVLAGVFMKMANDIRWMASGPRCGIGELLLPENEPGSSIMPGKVNPTQSEAMTMAAIQVMGNDTAIGFAGSQGNFELNVYKPLMIYNLLQSIDLLADAALNFADKCVKGIKPNRKRIAHHLERSLMSATLLNEEIGYDLASKIVRKAYTEDLSIREAALALKAMTPERFDAIMKRQKG